MVAKRSDKHWCLGLEQQLLSKNVAGSLTMELHSGVSASSLSFTAFCMGMARSYLESLERASGPPCFTASHWRFSWSLFLCIDIPVPSFQWDVCVHAHLPSSWSDGSLVFIGATPISIR